MSVITSAAGTATQMPVMPKNLDSRKAIGAMTTSPRIKEMINPKSARSMALRYPANTMLKQDAR